MENIYKTIKIQTIGRIGVITLNSPETLNIIEPCTFKEIETALDEFLEKEQLSLVLINANSGKSKKGRKVFSAGVNLKEYPEKLKLVREHSQEFRENLVNSRELMTRIENYSMPVVIAIDGAVKGGFFELALYCDVILASTDAVFSLSEINVGLIPGYGGIHKLLSIVGKNRAFEIISSGREIKAEETKAMGIVAEVFSEKEFSEKTFEYCRNLSEKSSNSLGLIKSTINSLVNIEPVEKIEVENFMKAVSHPDAEEGIGAFLEKRKAEF